MSDKIAKSPQIRFARFTDDWEQHEVGEFLEESKIKGSDGSVAKKLTVKLWRKGIVLKEEIYKGSIATQYYIRKSGQFMYGKLDFLNQAFGIVPDELNGYESTLDSPAFDFKNDLSPNFFLEYVALERFYKYQGNIANGSRKAKRIHVETFFKMPISIPSYEEQQKIGLFFKQLDDIIDLHQHRLNLLKEKKQSMLQQMFPRAGADVPEIRFAGFTDAWEQRKLNNILKERKTKQKISEEVPLLAFASGQGVIDRSERKTNNRDFLTKDSTKKTYLLTKYNDIVYNPSNLKYGAIDRNKYGQGVISPIYVTFETDEIPSFIELILKSENFKQRALHYEEGTVTKRQSVKPENLLNLDIVLPNNKAEQIKLGKFFEQLNDTISLYQRELNSLKNLKKSLKQQMFI